uniref:Bcl-2 Bcl-2 homology region 1-3 domain-containing protein n=1 Tax=Haplochromis burtoni TaxID=8153 RepID=A0A3Q3C2Q2_HAPBU
MAYCCVFVLYSFIYERVQRQRDGNRAVTREQLDGSQLTDPKHKKLAQCLQHIGDELDGNVELQRMINNSSLCPTRKVFMRVASEIFSDGIFNWGRVVALFYFACRLVIKVRETAIADSPVTTLLVTSCFVFIPAIKLRFLSFTLVSESCVWILLSACPHTEP